MPIVTPHVIALLQRDVNSTVGEGYGWVIAEGGRNVASLDVHDGDAKLVEDVQRYLMDMRVDTCWPACPLHGSHPLLYRAASWWCEMDDVEVCRLGSYHARPRSE